MVLLDTCTLLWWTLNPDKLSVDASHALTEGKDDSLLLSSISIWEVGIKVKKGKLKLPLTFDDYLSRVRRLSGLTIVPVDEIIWAENLRLDWAHPDPADRTIVATARLRRAPIVTADKLIADYYPEVVW